MMSKSKKHKGVIISVRCLWCGRRQKIKKAMVRGRMVNCIIKHKAPVPWEMRNDDLCPGSNVRLKDFADQKRRLEPKYK